MIEACQKKDTILRLNNTDIFIKIIFSLNIKLEVQGMLTIFSISIFLENILLQMHQIFDGPQSKGFSSLFEYVHLKVKTY